MCHFFTFSDKVHQHWVRRKKHNSFFFSCSDVLLHRKKRGKYNMSLPQEPKITLIAVLLFRPNWIKLVPPYSVKEFFPSIKSTKIKKIKKNKAPFGVIMFLKQLERMVMLFSSLFVIMFLFALVKELFLYTFEIMHA